jgi:hypothetical protein
VLSSIKTDRDFYITGLELTMAILHDPDWVERLIDQGYSQLHPMEQEAVREQLMEIASHLTIGEADDPSVY